MSVEVGYVANRGRDVFAGDGPDVGANDPTLEGFPSVSQNQRRPFFAGNRTDYLGLGGNFGWTQGIGYFCNCANNWYDSVQAKFNKRFSDGYAVQVNYTWQKAEGEGGGYFFWDRTLKQRRPGLGPHEHRQRHAALRTAVRQEQADRPGLVRCDGGDVRRLAGQRHPHHSERDTVQRRIRRQRRGPRYRPGPAESHRRSGRRQDARSQWFNTTPIGASGSAFGDPAVGTFGDMERNSIRGPYYRRTDASLAKHFRFGNSNDLEIRIEAVNLFNVVNLGNPSAEVGTLASPRPNAGRIS